VKLKPGVQEEGRAACGAGENQRVVVPVGAEVAAAAAVGGAGIQATQQQHDWQLQLADIEKCVLIYIPDGHTKSMRL
jgi:hypothetical protein